MHKTKFLSEIIGLFRFKTIFDEQGNELVLFSNSKITYLEGITDKTEFEASENHVHLLEGLNKQSIEKLVPVAKELGQLLLDILSLHYPDKHFFVFVTLHLHDSMIIRFHQKWENEEPFCNAWEYTTEKERVFSFEN